jgi:hypothetical protein
VAGEIPEKISRLCCPRCGNDDFLKFRYVEKIEVYRQVLGVKNGELQINGLYQSGEGYDDGEGGYFECLEELKSGGTCLYQWPVPDWVAKRIDWV